MKKGGCSLVLGSHTWLKGLEGTCKGAWSPIAEARVGFRLEWLRPPLRFSTVCQRGRISRLSLGNGDTDLTLWLAEHVARQIWESADRRVAEQALVSGGLRVQGNAELLGPLRHWLGPGETSEGRRYLCGSFGWSGL